MSTYRFGTMCAVAFGLGVAAMPWTAFAATDACTLLTPAQISSVKFVTLYLQTAASYGDGKQMASQMATMGKGAAMTPASVGDDGYYFVVGSQVGLLVKKGRVAFKVAVYATLPVQQKEAMELKLARDVLAKL